MRQAVERARFVLQIVGANDGGVASGVAAAEPAAFEHGDVAHAVFAGEVIRRAEAMSASAHDDNLVATARRRATPSALPAAVSGKRVAREGGERVGLHENDQRGGKGKGANARGDKRLLC